jgi:hypothetical protein
MWYLHHNHVVFVTFNMVVHLFKDMWQHLHLRYVEIITTCACNRDNRGCNAVFAVMCDHIYINRTVESNDSTFCVFLAAASLSVCVASCCGGCRGMLWTSGPGPLFLFRGGLTKSLSPLPESMSTFIGYATFILAAPFICECQYFTLVTNVLYNVNANLMC